MPQTSEVVLCLASILSGVALCNSAKIDSRLSYDDDSMDKTGTKQSLASLLLSTMGSWRAPQVANSLRNHRERSSVHASAGFASNPLEPPRNQVGNAPCSEFLEWANTYSSAGLSFQEIDGIRGVVPSEQLEAGATVMKVPKKMGLEVNTLTPCPEWCTEDIWKQSKWDTKMAMMLLREKDGAGMPEERQWLELLPRTFDTPIFNPDILDMLRKLKYTSLVKAVEIQRREWDASRKNVDVSVKEWDWAMSVVRSRCFSGAYKPGAFRDAVFQAFLVSIVALIYVNVMGTPDASDSARNALSAYFVYLLLSEFVIGPRFVATKLKQHVLCPMLDMFNHDSKLDGSQLAFNYFSSCYELSLDPSAGNVNKGDEIKISYGKQTNDALLQYYGFVEVDNPYDFYKIDLAGFVKRIQEAQGVQADAAQTRADLERVEKNIVSQYEMTGEAAIAISKEGVDELGRRIVQLLAGVEEGSEQESSLLSKILEGIKAELMRGMKDIPSALKGSASKVMEDFVAEKLRVISSALERMA